MKSRYLIYLLVTFITILTFTQTIAAEDIIEIEYFYSNNCPDCARTTPIINEIEEEYQDKVIIERLEVSDVDNWDRWYAYGFVEVPAIVVNKETKISIDEITKEYVILVIEGYTPDEKNESIIAFDTPFGIITIDPSQLSLPALAIILGALDSINPCSFWVLLFLLSLLIYVRSKRRILLIGSIFIFFSGFIYFLLMAALTSLFILTEQQTFITIIAGVFALILGAINIKDFFFFKKGPSLSIPESKKPELFKKMRNVVKASHLPSMIIGTVMLAIFANTYELFCTLGLPLTFTRILTLHNLPASEYYLYVLLYNIVYVVPLIIIVLIFALTFGKYKLKEEQARILKLFSGLMMSLLGLVLIAQPKMLESVLTVLIIPAIAIIVTIIARFLTKIYSEKNI